MKKLKQFLWFVGLFALCGSASAEPVSAAFAAFGSWMASASIPTILATVGSAITVVSSLSQGRSSQQAIDMSGQAQNQQSQLAAQSADSTAAQLEQEAGQQRAAGQRRSLEQRRQAAIAASDIQARTGGGSTDASIMGLTGNIAGEGEYNALTNIYEAEETARGYEGKANTSRTQGQLYRMQGGAALQRSAAASEAAGAASDFKAASTIFSAGSSLYSKFGNGGPSAMSTDYNEIGRLER